jgi:hypothetical protein
MLKISDTFSRCEGLCLHSGFQSNKYLSLGSISPVLVIINIGLQLAYIYVLVLTHTYPPTTLCNRIQDLLPLHTLVRFLWTNSVHYFVHLSIEALSSYLLSSAEDVPFFFILVLSFWAAVPCWFSFEFRFLYFR